MKNAVAALVLFLTACEVHNMTPTECEFWKRFRRDELGSTKIVAPSQSIGRGQYQKMIDVDAPDACAVPILVSIRSEYSIEQPVVLSGTGPAPSSGNEQIGSPLVGRVEWGVGGGFNAIEFDVPSPRIPSNNKPIGFPESWPTPDIGNGIQLVVTGSAVRVYVRNDSNIGVSLDPTVSVNPGPAPHVPSPAKVISFIGPGGVGATGASRLTRTIFAVTGGVNLGPGQATTITVPMFAKRVRFPRTPIGTTPLAVDVRNTSNLTTQQFNVGANEQGLLELFSTVETELFVLNQGAVNITQLYGLFEVDPL